MNQLVRTSFASNNEIITSNHIVFTTFLIPAIASPKSHDFLTEELSKHENKSFLFFSSLFKALSSELTESSRIGEREEFMEAHISNFVKKYREKTLKFLSELIKVFHPFFLSYSSLNIFPSSFPNKNFDEEECTLLEISEERAREAILSLMNLCSKEKKFLMKIGVFLNALPLTPDLL